MKKQEKIMQFIQKLLGKIILNIYIMEYKLMAGLGVFGIFFLFSYFTFLIKNL